MAPDVGGDQRLGQLRGQLDKVEKERIHLHAREQTLRKEVLTQEAAARVQAEEKVKEETPEAEPEIPSFSLDRFAQSLAWRPSRLGAGRLACESVIRKYAVLPVTLFCGYDPASKEVEAALTSLFEGSCRVSFSVRHFNAVDECNMEAVLAEPVPLLCFHCSGKEGEADSVYARALRKKLHYAGKGWTDTCGPVPEACSVFGWGYKDPYVMLYRNSRGDSGYVAEALEALGSTPLLKHLFADEDVVGGVPAAARQWAVSLAQKVEDWSRGCWEAEAEVLKGPEWTFEEIMRWDFIVNRRGMQDG